MALASVAQTPENKLITTGRPKRSSSSPEIAPFVGSKTCSEAPRPGIPAREGGASTFTQFVGLAANTALLALDMPRYFTEPAHAFARVAASLVEGGADSDFNRVDQVVIPNIRALLSVFRENGWPVLYTQFGSYLAEGADLPSWVRRLNDFSRTRFGEAIFPAFGAPSAGVDPRVAPPPGEPVLRKTTSGAVASSSLEQNLRARGIDHVIVTGVVTAFCVSQTARELADRDFDVAIIGDACASLTETGHASALTAFAGACGWVLSTEQITDLLPTRKATP